MQPFTAKYLCVLEVCTEVKIDYTNSNTDHQVAYLIGYIFLCVCVCVCVCVWICLSLEYFQTESEKKCLRYEVPLPISVNDMWMLQCMFSYIVTWHQTGVCSNSKKYTVQLEQVAPLPEKDHGRAALLPSSF